MATKEEEVKIDERALQEFIVLLTEAPPEEIDPTVITMIEALVGGSTEQIKDGLNEVISVCVRCALASRVALMSMNMVWEALGGQPEDFLKPGTLSSDAN
ncbi:MAG: hypothetical protein WC763_06075 [Candidatus Paceibacterota bacterium]|jgi:hypothetical protein